MTANITSDSLLIIVCFVIAIIMLVHTNMNINSVRAKLGNVEAKVGSVETKVSSVETKVGSVETDISGVHVSLQRIERSVPLELSPEMFTRLQTATFAILDATGRPLSCGFFVTSCGVALTAAHSSKQWMQQQNKKLIVRASTYQNEEFTLQVIYRKVRKLDIAVLRVESTDVTPRAHLPLPTHAWSNQELSGAPVKLVHCSIAWSNGATPSNFAHNNGYISTTSDTLLHYDISTYKGHSGAALLLRSEHLIGLHSEGFNDLANEHSETSPSTGGDAVRLDLPEIKSAVQRATTALPCKVP